MPTITGRVPTAAERWQSIKALAWIGECPPDEEGAPCVNSWVFDAARACADPRWLPLKPEQAEEFIRASLTRPEKSGEIRRAVSKAYGQAYRHRSQAPGERETFEPYDPEWLAEIASRIPFEITDDWLAEVSPECVLDVLPSQYLDTLSGKPGESFAVKRRENDLGFIYQVGNSDLAKRLNAYVKRSEVGAWYYANPVDGERRESGACYGDDRTCSLCNLMVESDKAPKPLWLAMIVQLRVPILAMYESGGRSVHAIIRVEAGSKTDFDKIAATYKRQLVPFGMCEGSGKATQATRLPGVYRADKGNWQRLLYLAPKADGTPIYKRSSPEV